MLIGVGLDGMVEARNYGAALRKTMHAAGCELPGDATATNGSSIRSAHIDMAGFFRPLRFPTNATPLRAL
jgi:hypothetical protein